MTKYKKQSFEAIAVYDYKSDSGVKALLLIDPEYSVLALCFYDEFGVATVPMVWNADNQTDIISSMAEGCSGFKNWREGEALMKKTLRDYYMSGRAMDGVAYSGVTELSASKLMELYINCGGKKLESALKAAEDILNEKEIPSKDIRFLFLGEMNSFYPAQCIVRLFADPMMPMLEDNRIDFLNDTDTAIKEGEALIEKSRRKVIENDLEWLILRLDSENKCVEDTVVLAKANTFADEFSSPAFAEDSVFFDTKGQITLRVDGAKKSISVPSGVLPEEGGLLQLGLQFEEGVFFLCFRGRKGIKTTPVELKVKGA